MNSNSENNALWADNINIAITVADINDNIVYMNEKSKKTFTDSNIGSNMANCHKPESNAIIAKMKAENTSNAYTIEKNGTKKFIFQTPWYDNGTIAGLVEFSMEIPFDMPHKIRK
ncbi:MAG: PAS domain-containing protein [Ignavibacteria bacterium]|jgi:DUF438 domain-containing protein|nr:PAS domain-containing protein [Ignavibacteria bacterium]